MEVSLCFLSSRNRIFICVVDVLLSVRQYASLSWIDFRLDKVEPPAH